MLSSDVNAVPSVGAKLGCAASMGLCAGCQIGGWAHSHLIGSTQDFSANERIQKTSDRMSEACVLDCYDVTAPKQLNAHLTLLAIGSCAMCSAGLRVRSVRSNCLLDSKRLG